jgi:hypothetical protein
MTRIGRTHRSVEFKHQNISAVLDELGMPWIRGYIPKRNYQKSILDAIDRYLSRNPAILEIVVPPGVRSASAALQTFVAAPELVEQPTPVRLQHLVRKFDPVERDRRNRALGRAGEEFVVDVERQTLQAADRGDLAEKVRWVALEDGDAAGYDVLSFEIDGREKFVEVKTTNGSARTPFYLTRNEHAVGTANPDIWRIHRVHLFSTAPQIFTLSPPLEAAVCLRPESWRASFVRA